MTFSDLNISASNLIPSFVRGVNEATNIGGNGGIIGMGLIIMVFIVAFTASKVASLGASMVFSSLLGLIVSILASRLGYIGSGFIYLMGIFLLIGIFLILSEK